MDKKKVVLRYNLVSVRFYLTMPQFPSDIISEPVSLCHIFPRTYFFLLNFLSELPSLLDITSQPASFCPFYLITLFFVSYFISKSFFLPDLTSQPQTLCHILPQYIQLSKFTFVLHYFCQIFPLNLLLCQFSPQNCYFLSSFTSEPPSFCRFYLRILFLPDCTSVSSTFYQILPQNHLVSVKFYLKTSNFLSDFAPKLLYVWFYLESTNICQILPQNPLLSFRFYLRTSFLLSVFISEPPSFCQILPQSPLFCVTFYLKASKFVSHFTSQSDIFYQMVPQNLFGCHFYLRTSSVCQILPQNVFLFFRFSREPFFFCQILPQVLFFSSWQYLKISLLLSFLSQNFHPLHPLSDFTLEPPFFLSDLTSNSSTLFRSLSDTHQHKLVKLYPFYIFHHWFFQCCFPALQRKILNRVCEELHSFPSIAFLQ